MASSLALMGSTAFFPNVSNETKYTHGGGGHGSSGRHSGIKDKKIQKNRKKSKLARKARRNKKWK